MMHVFGCVFECVKVVVSVWFISECECTLPPHFTTLVFAHGRIHRAGRLHVLLSTCSCRTNAAAAAADRIAAAAAAVGAKQHTVQTGAGRQRGRGRKR